MKKTSYLHITEGLSLKMMPDLNLWILQASQFEKDCIEKNKNWTYINPNEVFLPKMPMDN